MTPPPAARFDRAPLRPLVGNLSLRRLARFRRLMAAEGQAVDLARMCLDRRYAHERLARAHTSASDRLRATAVALFAGYETLPALAPMH